MKYFNRLFKKYASNHKIQDSTWSVLREGKENQDEL